MRPRADSPTGIIFDIKRYAIHDGPGIRTTVFFKGCPLRCPWCHNPEGIAELPEIMYRPARCAEDCTACVSACPRGVPRKDQGLVRFDKSRCALCGLCEEACVYGALEIIGRRVTVDEVMAEIEKDRIFFEESKGGVTFSGGEPLGQVDFLDDLLRVCRSRDIHTTVDTSGFFPTGILDRIADNVDLFLFDIKHMDDAEHQRLTGVSNRLIFENLRAMASNGSRIAARLPLLAGINDDPKNIEDTAGFLKSLGSIHKVNLLPYHKGGRDKYRLLVGQDSPSFQPPAGKRMNQIKKIFESADFEVKIGG